MISFQIQQTTTTEILSKKPHQNKKRKIQIIK